jgi:hypothetical protein
MKSKLSIPDYADIYFHAATLKEPNAGANFFLSEMKRRKVNKEEFIKGIKLIATIAEQMIGKDKNKSITKEELMNEFMHRLNQITKVINTLEEEYKNKEK